MCVSACLFVVSFVLVVFVSFLLVFLGKGFSSVYEILIKVKATSFSDILGCCCFFGGGVWIPDLFWVF